MQHPLLLDGTWVILKDGLNKKGSVSINSLLGLSTGIWEGIQCVGRVHYDGGRPGEQGRADTVPVPVLATYMPTAGRL